MESSVSTPGNGIYLRHLLGKMATRQIISFLIPRNTRLPGTRTSTSLGLRDRRKQSRYKLLSPRILIRLKRMEPYRLELSFEAAFAEMAVDQRALAEVQELEGTLSDGLE